MEMSATADLNQKIILMNLDIMEETGSRMHHALDEYVDKVIDVGKLWTTSTQRSQSSFLEVYHMITKAMTFLSLKCDEIKGEHLSCLQRETPNLIEWDELPQQQKRVLMDSCVDNTGDFSVVTTHRESTEDYSDGVKNSHTCRELNLEIDQQTRYEYFYNQLKKVMAKQDGIDQQVNTKFIDLREEVESLKLNVDQINSGLSHKVGEINSDLSHKVDEIDKELSAKVNEVNTDFSKKVRRINTELSDKIDKINTELSDKVDEIKVVLTHKVDEINTELSGKIDDVTTELSDKVDEIDKELSANVDELNTDLSTKVGRINTELSGKIDEMNTKQSGKVDEINTELSGKIDEINTKLSHKVDEINTDFSDKIDQIYTHLSTNADQIGVVLGTLSNSQQEHAAQINKIVDLENHFNKVQRGMQKNVRQVEQQLGEVGSNYTVLRWILVKRLTPLERLRDILNERARSQIENVRQLQAVTTEVKDISRSVEMCIRKFDVGIVGFNAKTILKTSAAAFSIVQPFDCPRFISGCQFNSTTGIFTASLDGVYLAYISVCIYQDGNASIYLVHREKPSKGRSCGLQQEICWADTGIKGSFACNIGMKEMKAGDKLFIRMFDATCVTRLINFSCFRIC